MPYRRRRRFSRRKRRRPKRRRRRRRGRRVGQQTVRRIPRAPFARSTVRKHRYVETALSLIGTGLAPVSHVFRANSVYDPDLTSTGHQPMGCDQMAVFFHHYTVIGFKAKVTFRQDQNVSTLLLLCLDAANTALDSASLYERRLEEGTCKSIVLNGANQYSVIMPSLSYACNPNKFLGISGPMGNADVRGTSGGIGVGDNPEEECYFKIGACPLAAANVGVTCTIQLEYTVVWTEPKVATQS